MLAGEKSIIIKDPVFVFFDLKNNHIKRNLMRYRDDILVGVDTHQFFVTKKLDSLSSYFILTKSILEKYNDNYFFREFRVSQNGVFLGKNTKIRNASSVREASIIGSGALISHDSICKS